MTWTWARRAATLLLGVYAVVWVGLEGRLWQAVVLAAGIALLSAAHLGDRLHRPAAGRAQRYGVGALLGAIVGAGTGLVALILMAVKTGLHAHGPEFTPAEVAWVLARIPIWFVVGVLAGLGVAMLMSGRRSRL